MSQQKKGIRLFRANPNIFEDVPRDGVDTKLFREALDKFIDFYRQVYQMMTNQKGERE